MIKKIDHTSDAEIRVVTDNLEQLFEECMWGMLSLITEGKAKTTDSEIELEFHAYEIDNLLIKFLTEILFIVQDEYKMPGKLEIKKLKKNKFSAILFVSDGAKIFGEIKNVTYQNFQLEKKNELWECKIIFDT